jgi:hypothetical protein
MSDEELETEFYNALYECDDWAIMERIFLGLRAEITKLTEREQRRENDYNELSRLCNSRGHEITSLRAEIARLESLSQESSDE